MSILEFERPQATAPMLAPELAGTLMSPGEFDQAEEADGGFTYCRSDGPDVIVRENESYTTPLLPGFELSVARLLQVADRWSHSKEQP